MAADAQVEPTARRYALQLVFHASDPILVDRDRLERLMTEELIDHARRDGVEINKEARLPGFSLHRGLDGYPPTHVVARIQCEVWQMPPWTPPTRWPRG